MNRHRSSAEGLDDGTVPFRRREDDVEIKFPFGVAVRATGRSVVIVVIALALVGVVVWHDYKSTQQNTSVVEALQAVSYVLTLNETERKSLRLQMPDSIRSKLEASHDIPRGGHP